MRGKDASKKDECNYVFHVPADCARQAVISVVTPWRERSGKIFQWLRKESESRPPTSNKNTACLFYVGKKSLHYLFLLSLSLFPNHPLMAFEESCDKYKTTFRYIQTFLQKVFNILSTYSNKSCPVQKTFSTYLTHRPLYTLLYREIII